MFFFFYIIKNTWVLFAHKRKCFPIIFHPIHIIFISYSLWNTSRYLLSHYFDQHCGHSSWSLSTLQALFLDSHVVDCITGLSSLHFPGTTLPHALLPPLNKEMQSNSLALESGLSFGWLWPIVWAGNDCVAKPNSRGVACFPLTHALCHYCENMLGLAAWRAK